MEAQNKKYRIVCEYPSDYWKVLELVMNEFYGSWMCAYICEAKGKDGYEEAKKWIKEQG